MKTGPKIRSVMDRFTEKIIPEPNSGCWLWTASLDRFGYGKLGRGGGLRGWVKASRVAWELFRGPIPDKMQVLHRCDNPPCSNPDHLFIGTAGDNVRDCARKGRMYAQNHPERFRVKRGPQPHRWKSPAPCMNCGKIVPARRRCRGRCHACACFFRRNKADRIVDPATGLVNRHDYKVKISHARVAELRARGQAGEHIPGLAKEYGIARSYAWAIVTGRSRKAAVPRAKAGP